MGTQAKQIEMDKTAELYKQLHEDRRKLIEQWEESVNNMKSRDNQLERLSEEYADNQQRKKLKEEKMKDKKSAYDKADDESKKLEEQITTLGRQLERMRLDHVNVKAEHVSFKDEVEILKNQLGSTESERTTTRKIMNMKARTLDAQKQKHETLQRNFQAQQRSLDDARQCTKEKDAMSAEAERMRNEMVHTLKSLEKDVKLAKDNLYKESQELARLRAGEADTLGEISGATSAIKNLQFQIGRLDTERQRQQELLYAVDFQSQLMQRKVARVSGERTVEEKEEFNKKLEQLGKQLEEQQTLHSVLLAQNKRQDTEVKNAQRILAGIHKENDSMKGSMEELELTNTIMNRTVGTAIKEKEESLMQHDVLRLEVKRLRQQLNSKSESVFSLENRKQQLRCADEERHKAAIELAERKRKIYNLKMKYENVLHKVKREGDEETRSQAYFVLKAAQNKEELQRKGDEMDNKIRKAEREIRALENTLGHLLARNKRYKENFQQATTQNQSELEEKQMLEDQSRAANEVLFRKKKAMAQLDREEEEDRKRHEELQANLKSLGVQRQNLTAERDVLDHDLHAQNPKLERAAATKESWTRRAMEAGVELTAEAPHTLDIDTKCLKDLNQSVVASLGTALQEHPDVLRLFVSLCAEKGVVRPPRPPSAASRPPSGRTSGLGSQT